MAKVSEKQKTHFNKAEPHFTAGKSHFNAASASVPSLTIVSNTGTCARRPQTWRALGAPVTAQVVICSWWIVSFHDEVLSIYWRHCEPGLHVHVLSPPPKRIPKCTFHILPSCTRHPFGIVRFSALSLRCCHANFKYCRRKNSGLKRITGTARKPTKKGQRQAAADGDARVSSRGGLTQDFSMRCVKSPNDRCL